MTDEEHQNALYAAHLAEASHQAVRVQKMAAERDDEVLETLAAQFVFHLAQRRLKLEQPQWEEQEA